MKLDPRGLAAAYASIPADKRDMSLIASSIRAYVDAADWAHSYIDLLNELCEKHGCPAGSDRLSWLDEKLSRDPAHNHDDDRDGGFDGPTGAD